MVTAEVKVTVLHLFRHLLRAASYLPDDFAQVYFRNHIKQHFRRGKRLSQHTPTRLKNARNSLSSLQRAADGDQKCLTKVLERAYGRSGKRRRELIDELLRADANSTQESDAPVNKVTAGIMPQNGDPETPRPLLSMLLRSQAVHQPPNSNRPVIRETEPHIPKSIWQRPIPLKRQKNIVKKFWASTLDKLLPPLPEVEWQRLRDLATGDIPFKGPPPRRPRAGISEGRSESLLSAATFLKESVRAAARPSKDDKIREREKHNITPRFMRRMWAGIWNQSPLMTYNGVLQAWTIVWGGNRSAASRGLTGTAGKKDLRLFRGMDPLFVDNLRGQRAEHQKGTQRRKSMKFLRPLSIDEIES